MQNIDIENLAKWLINDDEKGVWEYEINGKQVEKIEFKDGKKYVSVCDGLIDYPKEKTIESYKQLASFVAFLTICNDGNSDEEEDGD